MFQGPGQASTWRRAPFSFVSIWLSARGPARPGGVERARTIGLHLLTGGRHESGPGLPWTTQNTHQREANRTRFAAVDATLMLQQVRDDARWHLDNVRDYPALKTAFNGVVTALLELG